MAPKIDYIEAQLNLEPSSSAYIVDLKLPTTVAAGRARRNKAQADTRDEFRARTCATAASLYRRTEDRQRKYPRALLWRVLEDDTVLSVRSGDVIKPNAATTTNLILNFQFTHSIRPACIAFYDSPEHDAVSIFVLDAANQLYNLVLRADSFRKRSFAEGAVTEWCKVHVPNSLNNFKHPYRLVAVNNDQLITTLADGGLIRFDRNKSGSSRWRMEQPQAYRNYQN